MLMILMVVLCVYKCTISADSVLYTYTNRHPSAVMIIHNSHQADVRCTGNLLSSWWVLTAARCVFDRTGIRIDTKYIQVRAKKTAVQLIYCSIQQGANFLFHSNKNKVLFSFSRILGLIPGKVWKMCLKKIFIFHNYYQQVFIAHKYYNRPTIKINRQLANLIIQKDLSTKSI